MADNFFDQFDARAEPSPASEGQPLRVTVTKAPPPPAPPDSPPPLDPRARDLAIRTIWGEAEDQGDLGQEAVANVIRNRVQAGRYGGRDVPSVVLARNQFEPWARPDARARMLSLQQGSPEYERIGAMVDRVFTGQAEDPTQGSTHFFSPRDQAALGRRAPSWASGQPIVIGGHNFYAPEGRVTVAGVVPAATQPAAPPEPPPKQAAPANFFDQFDTTAPHTASVLDYPAISQTQAGVESALKGASAGFRDEVLGASQASGLPEVLGGLRAPVGAARLGYEYLTGQQGEATRRYEEATQRARDLQAEAERAYPKTAIASEIAGAVASPVGRAGGVGSTALRTGLRQGAAYGALSGAGEGTDLPSRVTGAVTGGALGGAAGGLGSLAASGVLGLGGMIARPITSYVSGLFTPNAVALRNAAGAIAADVRAGRGGISPSQWRAAQAEGTPVANVDLGGPRTLQVARSAADTSPEARGALETLVRERDPTQGRRIINWLNEQYDFPDPTAMERLQEAARMANRRAYNRTYAEGAGGIWDNELAQLVQAPDIQTAFKAALREARNRSAAGRGGPFVSEPPPQGQIGDGPLQRPTLEFWDLVQRKLRQMGASARTQNKTDDAANIDALRSQLNAKLDAAVPSFRQARAGAAGFFGAEDAYDAGIKYAGMQGLDPRKIYEARRVLGQMSEPERKLFDNGFVSSIIARIENMRDSRDLTGEIYNSKFARDQITSVLGQQRANELEARLQVERVMHALKTKLGGSQTSGNVFNMALAGGLGWGGTGYLSGDYTSPAAIGGALVAWGRGRIDQRVARRVGELLASKDPAALDRLSNAVAKNESWRQFFRTLAVPGVALEAQRYRPAESQ